jgi:hypothetical protein|tara:strand:+ start:159 stop:365 length:207 start_codon:yes stop_codon:yes gene_type:complete
MELKKHLDILNHEMNILGEKILEKDEQTGNRRGNYHTALWVLKERVDELTKDEETSSGAGSSDTKVSK